MSTHPFDGIDDGRALAKAIVDTIREPLLVLDNNLRVVAASRSFYLTFEAQSQDVQGRPFNALGDGQWNIPELRLLLEEILSRPPCVMEAYEVEQEFSGIGRRIMLLNARRLSSRGEAPALILLAFEDVTERRAAQHELTELLRQKEFLLEEMRHRVANSLQIIASILLLKARSVPSVEVRHHLQEAHQRILSVAAVQQQLHASRPGEPIDLARYLSQLCACLAASMIGQHCPISLEVRVERGMASSTEAVGLGLIVTELVINAIKHAFVGDGAAGRIVVAYVEEEANWRLTVSDNGVGKPAGDMAKAAPGLGTSIVQALADQFDACVDITSASSGTIVSITHGSLTSPVLTAA